MALARAYVSGVMARNKTLADPFRTLGMLALILAKLENWELKTDQFSLVSGASRPTARKLLKIYSENGLAECLDESWFATEIMVGSLNETVKAIAGELSSNHPYAQFDTVRLALVRTEYAATQRLCPVQGRALFSLIKLYLNHLESDRCRIRNVLQDHSTTIGQDLEPELRRWILNGWVSTSDEHFFNDRWVQLTPMGCQISQQYLELFDGCLAVAQGAIHPVSPVHGLRQKN